MSIYSGLVSIDGDTDDPDNTTGAPYVYRGSHILPTSDGERAGYVEFAGIPAFCGTGGLVDFLRLSTAATDDGDPYVDVLLDRPQVERVRDALTLWLEREPEDA